MNQSRINATPRWQTVTVIVLASIILPFSLLGFGTKFIELVRVVRGDADGVFALTPIVNYLLASFGFLCLLLWAACKGTFRDIEQPKRWMLENELRLDATEQYNTRTICEERKR